MNEKAPEGWNAQAQLAAAFGGAAKSPNPEESGGRN